MSEMCARKAVNEWEEKPRWQKKMRPKINMKKNE